MRLCKKLRSIIVSSAVVIFICTDGSEQVGLGHVRRCLALAQALRVEGREVAFILRGDLLIAKFIVEVGFTVLSVHAEHNLREVLALAQTSQVRTIVVDSYTCAADFYAGLREAGLRIVAIDDLADRPLPVDVIMNGAVAAHELNYQCLPYTQKLLGAKYLLLRSEFAQDSQRMIKEKVERVLITVGGSDPHNLTQKVIAWVWAVLPLAMLDVVIGPFFKNQKEIELLATQYSDQVLLHHSPENMREIMLQCDVAVCAGGQTANELAATGTPALAISVAPNQKINLRGFVSAETLVYVGEVGDTELSHRFKELLGQLLFDYEWRERLSVNGRALVDGAGTQRAAQEIIKLDGV